MKRLVPGAVVAVAALLAAASAAPSPEATPKPPTAAVCVPKTIRMEYFNVFGGKLGEYDARFDRIEKQANALFAHRCLWVGTGPTDEAFVVGIGYVPRGTPGVVEAGNCDGVRKDSYPYYFSRKRFLTVSGGERKAYQNAVGGNERILKGVLAAAEAAGVGLPCPGAKPPPSPPKPPPPPPRPKPPPPPPLPSSGNLSIDYAMPDRFGLAGPGGIVEYHDTEAEIRPKEWRVQFKVARKDGKPCKGVLGLTLPGADEWGTGASDCAFHAVYPKEGTYTAKVTLTDGATKLQGTRTFLVQDWLIVGLGDSNGSGEGAPDRPGKIATQKESGRPAVWQNRQCHRSGLSYEAQAARAIERRDKRTSVTFVHLACSGATIVDGILGPYEGIEPTEGPKLPSQVAAMKRLVGKREVDAVLISIGVNDLRFGNMVIHCLLNPGCPGVLFPKTSPPRTLRGEMGNMLRSLPGRYRRMASALKNAGVEASRVYLSEYFDSTRDDNERFCSPLIDGPGSLDFDGDEGEWAHKNVLVPLNAHVAAAADARGWGLIRGAYRDFRRHGYCADDSWIVPLTGSILNQKNPEGTLHSTAFGNTKQAARAIAVVRPDLYPGDRTRAPR